MKILVIGGSLFAGRVFVMYASKKHDVTLLNRGNYSMKNFNVREYVMDRHNEELLRNIKEEFDVIVDFCAYQKGDIKIILDNINSNIKKYIFISTCDIYDRNKNILKKETDKLNYNTSSYPEKIKEYIDGKVQLENEIVDECKKRNIDYVSIRPSIIYGPYNYAPRESFYIKNIIQNQQAIFPIDATSKFQFVYVDDLAQAILKICEATSVDYAYNICSPDILDYIKFADILKKASTDKYEELFLKYEQLMAYGVPMPFPIFDYENNLCDGSKITSELDFSYTEHEKGMKLTYKAFTPVFKR